MTPDTDLKPFNDSTNDLRDTLEEIVLLGGFNIDIVNFDKHAETTFFVDMLHAHSFLSVII